MASIIDQIERAAALQVNDDVLAQHLIPLWTAGGPCYEVVCISIKIDPSFESFEEAS